MLPRKLLRSLGRRWQKIRCRFLSHAIVFLPLAVSRVAFLLKAA